MGLTQIHQMAICSVAVVLLAAFTYVSGDDVIIQKKMDKNRAPAEELLGSRLKRPFCNAFTGCGKKRSDGSMEDFYQLNGERMIQELSNQIVAEAKLWEAIKQAMAEMQILREERLNEITPSQGFDITGMRDDEQDDLGSLRKKQLRYFKNIKQF